LSRRDLSDAIAYSSDCATVNGLIVALAEMGHEEVDARQRIRSRIGISLFLIADAHGSKQVERW